MHHVLLEVTVAGAAEAVLAAKGGADRIELCAALDVDGLTPSLGELVAARESCPVPIVALVRPRPGNFVYSADELIRMHADIAAVFEHGADAVAFGALTVEGTIDREACRGLLATCEGRPAVFHRAFDLVPDPLEGLAVLTDLGFTRILTSGGPRSVVPPSPGAAVVRGLLSAAGGGIEILPAGGIRAESVRQVIQVTGCTQVHSSCRVGGQFDASELGRLRAAIPPGG